MSAEKNPARTLSEFIDWAKSQPRGVTVVPATTPSVIIERLSAAVCDIAADPAFQQRYLVVGALAAASSPGDLGAYAERERRL